MHCYIYPATMFKRFCHNIMLHLHFLFSYFKQLINIVCFKMLGDMAKDIRLTPSEGLKRATGRRP